MLLMEMKSSARFITKMVGQAKGRRGKRKRRGSLTVMLLGEGGLSTENKIFLNINYFSQGLHIIYVWTKETYYYY